MVPFEYCSNRDGIQKMQASLGQLLQNDSFAGNAQTKEPLKKICCFILPVNHHVEQGKSSMCKVSMDYENDESQTGCCNNYPLVVEQFKNESDRHNLVKSLGFDILDYNIETSDIEKVKRFGFNHIILISERLYGFLFMDCYGRVFDWDDMSDLLWPLGDYSKVAESKISWLAWGVESDGAVVEIETESPEQQRNNFLIAMKDKKTKKTKKI